MPLPVTLTNVSPLGSTSLAMIPVAVVVELLELDVVTVKLTELPVTAALVELFIASDRSA